MVNSNSNQSDTLIFACSGGSDVGSLSDRTARALSKEGKGKMFCSVGIGRRVEKIIETTRKAATIIAIDGCPLDCMKKSLENTGFNNYTHVRITDHDFIKGETTVDDASIGKTKNIVLNSLKN